MRIRGGTKAYVWCSWGSLWTSTLMEFVVGHRAPPWPPSIDAMCWVVKAAYISDGETTNLLIQQFVSLYFGLVALYECIYTYLY